MLIIIMEPGHYLPGKVIPIGIAIPHLATEIQATYTTSNIKQQTLIA